jgi:D-glycero-D-manno-heptose 1,7-bisphosphate phosphatase
MRPAVFLDRDGTINRMVYNAEFGLVDSPANPDEFELLPGAAEAVHLLNQAGLPVVVVSNQPGIAKGRFTPTFLDATTAKMHALLAEAGASVDAVYYCLHHPEARLPEYRRVCDCRKPQPGLLRQAAVDLNLDLAASFMVGDGITDVCAGQAAGARTIFLGSMRCYTCAEFQNQGAAPEVIAKDLLEATLKIRQLLAEG